MKIEGFILDIDGTLLSSLEAHLTAWRRAFRDYGIMKSDYEIAGHFGQPTSLITRDLIPNVDPQVQYQITIQKTEYFVEEIPHIPLYPGVQEILKQIHADGIPIIFASANYHRVLDQMLKAYGWDKLCKGYIGIEDVNHSKPDPEMVIKAAEKLQIPLEKCVTIGDSIYDIQAGQAAGTKTVAVCTRLSFDEWDKLNPDLILKRFGDLHPLLPLDL